MHSCFSKEDFSVQASDSGAGALATASSMPTAGSMPAPGRKMTVMRPGTLEFDRQSGADEPEPVRGRQLRADLDTLSV